MNFLSPFPCEYKGLQITQKLMCVKHVDLLLVSSPGRDSRDIRSSRLAEATQKPLGTNAL